MTIGEKVSGFLSGLFKQPAPFDPAVFGDPLAMATQWGPAVNGGTNFCTHRLKAIDQMCMEFKTTFGMKLFCFFFIVFGAVFGVIPLGAIYKQYGGFHWSMLMSSLFSLVFCIVGILIYYYSSQPIVFDRKRNCFIKGRKKEKYVELHKIRALQVLSEYCSGNKSSFYSYELNLVLEDASRVNVVDHGNLKALRDDANMLGQFLGVQVWDVEVARAGNVKKDTILFPDKW